MAQKRTESRPSSQPSALLMLSPEETNFSLLGLSNKVSNDNMPTLLMPVPVTTSDVSPSNLILNDETDVDSFIGQQPNMLQNPSNQFQSSIIYSSHTTSSTQINQPTIGSTYPITNVPSFGFANEKALVPPPPLTSSVAASSSQYRHTGKFQHVAPPQCSTYTQSPQPNYYQTQPNQFDLSGPSQNSVSQSSFLYTKPNQIYLGGFDHVGQNNVVVGQPYFPVDFHWFYMKEVEGKNSWFPFSSLDSKKLEDVYVKGITKEQGLVSVEGGRYDVDIAKRQKLPVFWSEEVLAEVRRCSWFYRPEGESQFVPYDEKFAAGLEESYKQTLLTSDFHKRLAFPSGETIIIHTPDTIVHYPALSQPDAWGNVANDIRPQVVRRGMVDFDNIPKDEHDIVDHLVLVVQGFKATFGGNNNKTAVEHVNEFRLTAELMLTNHFDKSRSDGKIGRVEFLPIIWSQEMFQDDVTQADIKLKSLNLGTVGKLKTFTNETLLDILFFTSPSHVMVSASELTLKLNSIVDQFKSRNPNFRGGVSVLGHGIGNLLLYDILLNQSSDNSSVINNDQLHLISNDSTSQQEKDVAKGTFVQSDRKNAQSSLNLEDVLMKLDLKEYDGLFQKEKIDLSSLVLLNDVDIKELNLPLGPRKKIQEFIKNHNKESSKFVEEMNPTKDFQIIQNQQQEHHKTHDKSRTTSPPTTAITSFSFTTNQMNTNKLKGIDIQVLKYSKLKFEVANFFALGSPVALLLALRGVHSLGDDFKLPTCLGYYNIFHPFDPLAYRMEPLILPQAPIRAVLIPHHKGRKRMHLELKESLARIGFDIKQRIVESFRSTWKTISNIAASYRPSSSNANIFNPNELKMNEEDVDNEVRNVLTEMQQQADDAGSVVASSVADELDIPVGSLNQGHRVDFVLQEKPIEIFNDYLFALTSSNCYWQSEDTVLMILKEIYLTMGVVAQKPGMPLHSHQPLLPTVPPPKTGFVQLTGNPRFPPPPTNPAPIPANVNQPFLLPPAPAALTSTNQTFAPLYNQPINQCPPSNVIGQSFAVGGVNMMQTPSMPPLVRSNNQMAGPPPRSGFVKL